MKTVGLLLAMALFTVCSLPLFAQSGNAVISEVKFYDHEDGTGTLEVRISGNQASQGGLCTAVLSSPRLAGGTFSGTLGPVVRGGYTLYAVSVPLLPATGSGPEFIDAGIEYENSNRGNKDIMAILIRRGG